MKTFAKSFLNNKAALALAFTLVLVGATAFFFGELVQKASADLVGGGGGSGDLGRPNSAGGGGGGGGGIVIPSGTPLCGFAWGATTGSQGIGWVSFNSKDCDADSNGTISAAEAAARPGCPAGTTGTYSVTVDEATGRLNGFAWSSNLGWIKFGCVGASCLSGNPSTPGNTQSLATRFTTGLYAGQVHGWARVCAGTAGTPPDDGECATMTSRNDGWDGWISLKGSSPAYGVTFNGGTFGGYSWGSSVVGWLKWSSGSDSGTSYAVRYCTTPTLIANLTANPSSGEAPLPPVTLTATSQPTGTNSYRFKCNTDDVQWSLPQASSTFICTGTYDEEGAHYYPEVEITQGALVARDLAVVETDSEDENPEIPNGEGDLSVSCSVTDPVAINQPATWTAEVTPGVTPPVPPYTYEFRFDDGQQPNLVSPEPSDIPVEVVRTYNILGRKEVTVYVEDNNGDSTQRATGSCTAETRVIVNPTIIEI